MEAYIKPANYEQIGTKKFEKEIGRKENMQYDKEEDYYICHNNKKLRNVKTKTVKTASGYLREETHYYCEECNGCPSREKRMSGKSEFTRFLCRGNENVLAEYILFAMAHNLGWLHSRIQNDKLDLHLYELKPDAAKAA